LVLQQVQDAQQSVQADSNLEGAKKHDCPLEEVCVQGERVRSETPCEIPCAKLRAKFSIPNSSSAQKNNHYREKIDTFVDFPLAGLDMAPYIIGNGEGVDGVSTIYDCFAVSNHFGGLGGGHYSAFAKNGGAWCKFDDSSVYENVSSDSVKTNAAYTLWYRRRDDDGKEGEGENENNLNPNIANI